MRTVKPNLSEYLAEEALRSVYDTKGLKELEDLRNICQIYMQSKNMKRQWMRMLKQQLKIHLTKAIINSLPEDQQRFVMLKYGKKKTMVYIQQDLYVTTATLIHWNKNILKQVSSYAIQMRLRENDIFFRDKIVNLIDTFSRIINFTSKFDPHYEVVSEAWLNDIQYKFLHYRAILSELDENIRERKNGYAEYIVATLVKAPNKSLDDYSRELYLNTSVISRHRRKFINAMQKHLQ